MRTAAIMEKMIAFPGATLKDIAHLVKVYGHARTIGKLEGLDERTQEILEIAAIVHDIACPLCREKYGRADGELQEKEGPALVRELLSTEKDSALVERVCWLVAHHHTYEDVSAIDHQILLEADFLVNADEWEASMEKIKEMESSVFRTASGKRLLKTMYQ